MQIIDFLLLLLLSISSIDLNASEKERSEHYTDKYRLHIEGKPSPSCPVHYDPDIIHITRDKERSEQYTGTCTYSV